MNVHRVRPGERRQGPIDVMIVDDHAVVRQGLSTYLEGIADIRLIDQAGDGREALDRLGVLSAHGQLPDVILMDLKMPRVDGVSATVEIVAHYPTVKVVVLTSFGEVPRVQAALEAGAVGYVLKDAAPEEIDAAVRTAMAGQVHLDPVVTRRLTQRMVSADDQLAMLTKREKDILALVAAGLSNQEIAEHLMISERTARTHVSNLLGKLHLRSRTQAALLAIREGLVPAPGTEDADRS
jgi:DNA-binding NarL/FixJ family response regulator